MKGCKPKAEHKFDSDNYDTDTVLIFCFFIAVMNVLR